MKSYIDIRPTVSLVAETLAKEQLNSLKGYAHTRQDARGNETPITEQLDILITSLENNILEKVLVYKIDKNLKKDVLLGMNVLHSALINFPEGNNIFFSAEMLT